MSSPVAAARIGEPQIAVTIDTDAVRIDKKSFAPSLEHFAIDVELDNRRTLARKSVQPAIGIDRQARRFTPLNAVQMRSPVFDRLVRLIGAAYGMGCRTSQQRHTHDSEDFHRWIIGAAFT